jgi:hypothetical protein
MEADVSRQSSWANRIAIIVIILIIFWVTGGGALFRLPLGN